MRLKIKNYHFRDIMHYGKNKDAILAFYLSSIIWFTALRAFAIEIGNRFLGGSGRMISLAMIGIFTVFAIVPFINYVRFTTFDGIVFLFVFVSILRSLIFHIDYFSGYVSIFMEFFFESFLFYLIARNVGNWKSVLEAMYRGGTLEILCIVAIFLIRYKFEGGQLFGRETVYSQFYGVLISKGAVIKITEFVDRKKFRQIPLIGMALCIIVICGTRTPFVSIVLTILCIAGGKFRGMFHKEINSKKQKRGRWKIVLVVTVAIAIGYRLIVYAMSLTMTGIKQGERILYQIANGKFFESVGRSMIFEAWKVLVVKPIYAFMGTGMIGDRIAIAKEINMLDTPFGTYCHNIFLELWLQNGLFIGTALILLVVAICYKAIFGNNISHEKRLVYIYLIGFGIGSMMVAGTNLECTELWVLLALGFRDVNIRQFSKAYEK